MPVRFQVDPDFYDHPKTAGMSDAAFSLWVRAGSFSAAKLTDGFIAENVLVHTLRSSTQVADELAERGLWKRCRGGYRFHEWQVRNLTRQGVEEHNKSEADRKRKERAKQKPAGQRRKRPPGRDPDSARTNIGVQPESDTVVLCNVVSPSGTNVPSGSTASEPEGSSAGPTSEFALPAAAEPNPATAITAQTVVAAWVDATAENGIKPTSSLKGQVARTARELLQAGNDPDRVLAAAEQAGASGYASIDRELASMAGRRRPNLRAVADNRDPKTGRIVESWL